jgi:hypothetical protein
MTPPAALAAEAHGAWVRFVTDGDTGWARYNTSTRPVRVLDEASATLEDPLRAEREAWAFLSEASDYSGPDGEAIPRRTRRLSRESAHPPRPRPASWGWNVGGSE